ncbi:MAG: lipoyl(octanoyl) transferase LipB [Methylotenera sp.]|nr:lipoyl(octanoyl) transferase LipB [Methylotenera sp.]MSP99007.1 lipoyl(octanoyl) transferase LipB [Methylotenera sp.]
MPPPIKIRHLGLTGFEETWHAMQQFTASRSAETADELWLTEHAPVYTLGLNRKHVRIPNHTDIPLVLTDRGGKITYHGPGQLILYVLLDLNRHQLNVRTLVTMLENSVIKFLAEYGVHAMAKANAPGVYVDDAKIAALGLRIKNNYCYHGLSLNINMDLKPFETIDPCGYVGLKVTQTKDLSIESHVQKAGEQLIKILLAQLTDGQQHD